MASTQRGKWLPQRFLGAFVLWITGWKVEGIFPDIPKMMAIFAPHTSNWDFCLALMMKWKLGVKGIYLGKHTIFKPPFGWFFYWVGGVPVRRASRHDMVQQVASLYSERAVCQIGIAPEGTRGYLPYWRSGFYHIARAANAPIVMIALDFEHRIVRIDEPWYLTGEIGDDMDRIRAFYGGIKGGNPEFQGPIRLADEVPAEEMEQIKAASSDARPSVR
jgi:1-acyl-sn-glycerol-3-phosphate acyltransferase